MRYRKLDANGDYSFGNQQADFYVNTPDAVAQAVLTRLTLITGEWFLDTTEGTPWATEVLGKYTQGAYDIVLKERIVGTPGVQSLDAYTSALDRNARKLTVQASITTVYGTTTFQATL
jgi:hypothetical protein